MKRILIITTYGIVITTLFAMIEELHEYKTYNEKQNELIHDLENKLHSLNKIIEYKENGIKELRNQLEDQDTYYEEQIFEVTAYNSDYESTGKNQGDPYYGITASGRKVKEGITAACPPSMDFGTILYIENVGYRVCEDRGGAIVEGHLDIYIEDYNEMMEFGRQKLKVKIFKEGEHEQGI